MACMLAVSARRRFTVWVSLAALAGLVTVAHGAEPQCAKVQDPIKVPAGTVALPGGGSLTGPGYYYTASNFQALMCRVKAKSSVAAVDMTKAELAACRAERTTALEKADKMLGECETSLTGVITAGEDLRKAQVELGQSAQSLKTEAEKTIEVLNKLEADGNQLLTAGDGLLDAQQALLESNRNLAAAVEKTPTQGMVITGAIIIAALAFGGGYAIGSL